MCERLVEQHWCPSSFHPGGIRFWGEQRNSRLVVKCAAATGHYCGQLVNDTRNPIAVEWACPPCRVQEAAFAAHINTNRMD